MIPLTPANANANIDDDLDVDLDVDDDDIFAMQKTVAYLAA